MVLTYRGALKSQPILEDRNNQREKLESDKELYTEQEYKKEISVLYAQTAFDMVKAFSPAVICAAASALCFIGSNRILANRNAALAAAYVALDEGFKAYRKRVRDEHGDEVDYAYRHGFEMTEVTETITDEDGKKHKQTRKVMTRPDQLDGHLSAYARIFKRKEDTPDVFSEGSDRWQPTAMLNQFFVQSQQSYWNEYFRATKKPIFLNDVYASLGFEKTEAGQSVGWYWKEGSDNKIDFGIFDLTNRAYLTDDNVLKAYDSIGEIREDFNDGLIIDTVLDFNVDGPIYQKLRRAI